MGIKGLIPFLTEKAPGSITEVSLESLSGEYVAVDASTALYQFSIAIRDSSYFSSLVNASGESTSHIYGLMSRCSKLLECGIKPVFVFDSKPPELKLKTLDKRRQKREEATTSLKQAISEGDKESIKKLVGRTVKVTKEMNDSAKKLLKLMGVPVIEALEEAEAQCAHLVRKSMCRFVASEDTDTLVFGGNYLLRNVTASSNKKIIKVDLQKALKELEITFEQFVDFCILCGCDYCDTLEGVGPKTAYSLVKKHENLEEIVQLKGGNYEDFREAKEYFMSPKVNEYDLASIKMGTPDKEALTEFLVKDNNFSKERVDKFVEKLIKCKNKKVQTSLMSFLQNKPTVKPVYDSGKRTKTSETLRNKKSLKVSQTRTKTMSYPSEYAKPTRENQDKREIEEELFDQKGLDEEQQDPHQEVGDQRHDMEEHEEYESQEYKNDSKTKSTEPELENEKKQKEEEELEKDEEEDEDKQYYGNQKMKDEENETKSLFEDEEQELNGEEVYHKGEKEEEVTKTEELSGNQGTEGTNKGDKKNAWESEFEDTELDLKPRHHKRVLSDDDLNKATNENPKCGKSRLLTLLRS